MKITLASTSKYKTEVLKTVKIKHDTIQPSFEETSGSQDYHKYVCEMAYGKANSVKDKVKEGIIIGLDTVVIIDDKIVKKPQTITEAKQNLRNSSNNTTKVVTGIALINVQTNEELIDYQETEISFRTISDEDIDFYIENEPEALYASGFIIETVASNFIKEIRGSYYNVLGVPVEKIYELLNYLGIYLKSIN